MRVYSEYSVYFSYIPIAAVILNDLYWHDFNLLLEEFTYATESCRKKPPSQPNPTQPKRFEQVKENQRMWIHEMGSTVLLQELSSVEMSDDV